MGKVSGDLERLISREPGWLRPYLRTIETGAQGGELRMDRLYKLQRAGLITLHRASAPALRPRPDDYVASITEEGRGLLATEDPRSPCTPPTLDELRTLMERADAPAQSPCDAIRFDQASGDYVRALLTGEGNPLIAHFEALPQEEKDHYRRLVEVELNDEFTKRCARGEVPPLLEGVIDWLVEVQSTETDAGGWKALDVAIRGLKADAHVNLAAAMTGRRRGEPSIIDRLRAIPDLLAAAKKSRGHTQARAAAAADAREDRGTGAINVEDPGVDRIIHARLREPVTHVLFGGFAMCGRGGIPSTWRPNEKWCAIEAAPELATCIACLCLPPTIEQTMDPKFQQALADRLAFLRARDAAVATVRDLLALVDRDVSLAEVEAWTPEMREEAVHWASAEHLHASDNPEIARLPVPRWVAGLPSMMQDGLWPRSRHDVERTR